MAVRVKNELRLHGGQYKVFSSQHRFKVVCAGRRWGKTQVSKVSIVSRAKTPNSLIWYVAPTYGMARSIMWPELIAAIPAKWIKRSNETRMTLELINGTRIELKGADKPDTLRGVGIDFLVIDEAQDIRPDTWYKVLRPTLLTTGGHALVIGTPKGFNWFYDLWKLGQDPEKRETGEWMSWQFVSKDSPFIPAAEIEAAKRDMDPKSFQQEMEASFINMAGRVYYNFSRTTHVKPCAFNPKLPVIIGMDFNIDPMSAVILQEQENGEIWAVDEIVLPGSNTEETGNEIERRYWRYAKMMTVYPDPAGAARSTKGAGKSDIQILRDKGFKRIKHRRQHPKVSDRINAVNRMLMSADGEIRLYVDARRCPRLIESLEQTIYKPGSGEIDKSLGVEHSTDALGYYIEFEYPVRKVNTFGVSR